MSWYCFVRLPTCAVCDLHTRTSTISTFSEVCFKHAVPLRTKCAIHKVKDCKEVLVLITLWELLEISVPFVFLENELWQIIKILFYTHKNIFYLHEESRNALNAWPTFTTKICLVKYILSYMSWILCLKLISPTGKYWNSVQCVCYQCCEIEKPVLLHGSYFLCW